MFEIEVTYLGASRSKMNTKRSIIQHMCWLCELHQLFVLDTLCMCCNLQHFDNVCKGGLLRNSHVYSSCI